MIENRTVPKGCILLCLFADDEKSKFALPMLSMTLRVCFGGASLVVVLVDAVAWNIMIVLHTQCW